MTDAERDERQRSIDKNVNNAMMLAFFAYLNDDQESIDVANQGMDACGYPRVPNIRRARTGNMDRRTT